MEKEIDLQRFVTMHRMDYAKALREIRAGRKETHWMWYIFPQIGGLAKHPSPTSVFFAIRSLAEAKAFLEDPYLGANLREISGALLELKTNCARDVFGGIDSRKLCSCMTLFACISEENSVFHDVLRKYYGGRHDGNTLEIVNADRHPA